MEEGYEHSDENDFTDLDEWLCEYVDGTIDPVVREALEEYMLANPALASHVENLRETRYLLCRFGYKHKAPCHLQPNLRSRLANEIINDSEPWMSRYNFPLATIALLSSLAAVLLILASTTAGSLSPTATALADKSALVVSKNVQLPVWKSSPIEALYRHPIYLQFTQTDLSIVPAELRFSTLNSAPSMADTLSLPYFHTEVAP